MLVCDICEKDITGVDNTVIFKINNFILDNNYVNKRKEIGWHFCIDCYEKVFDNVGERIHKMQNEYKNKNGNLRRIHDDEYNEILKKREV